MRTAPTYTAMQIKEMAANVCDYQAMKILGELINEEIELYTPEELPIIMNASMILFSRSLLMKFIKP